MAARLADDFSFADLFEVLGRAVERRRGRPVPFADVTFNGRWTCSRSALFDMPSELLQLDRTRSVAFFSVGSNVGDHGAWSARR